MLSRRKITTSRFKLPLSYEDAKKALCAAVEVEVNSRYRTFVLSEDLDSQLSQIAKWLTSENQQFGMLLNGCVGCGKTTMMKAFQNLLNVLNIKNENDTVGYRPYGMRIVDAKYITECYQNTRKEFDVISRMDMLGIDDLGLEPKEIMSYGNVQTPLVDLLFKRYENQLFTIVTTNLTPKQIRALYGDRIADRFNEMMKCIIFNNSTYRLRSSEASKPT